MFQHIQDSFSSLCNTLSCRVSTGLLPALTPPPCLGANANTTPLSPPWGQGADVPVLRKAEQGEGDGGFRRIYSQEGAQEALFSPPKPQLPTGSASSPLSPPSSVARERPSGGCTWGKTGTLQSNRPGPVTSSRAARSPTAEAGSDPAGDLPGGSRQQRYVSGPSARPARWAQPDAV